MADVQTLPGIRYAKEIVGDLAQIVAPRYDVISEEDQARYYARSVYNIISLELGRDDPGDNTLNNRYRRAASTYAGWRARSILRTDASACYSLYQQVFTDNGQ